MNIHIIPDNCMVNIFFRIPLRYRIRAGQVCSRWRWLRSSVVTPMHRSLTILVGPMASTLINYSKFGPDSLSEHLDDDGSDMPSEFSKNSLKLKSLGDGTETLYCLNRMFPNIDTLKIALGSASLMELAMAGMLLLLYGPKLVTLKVYCKLTQKRYIPQFVSQHLFKAINSLSSLKHLTLEFDSSFALSTNFIELLEDYDVTLETTSVDLPIISQLDEFNFYSLDDDRGDVMFDSFRRYAQHSQKPLRIQFGVEGFDNVTKLAQLNAQLCRRFTYLLYCYSDTPISPIENPSLFFVCARFTSITRIWIQVEQISMCTFLKTIAKLTNLAHLKMSVWFTDILPDEPNNEIYCQLPSVKTFDIAYRTTNHDNLSQFNIPWSFPNVQVISIRIFEGGQCDICDYDLSIKENTIPLDRFKQCCKQILSQIHNHLNKCSQLHTIANLVIEVQIEELEWKLVFWSLADPIYKEEDNFELSELMEILN